MDYKKLFSKYRRWLRLEALIKALVTGTAIGFAAVTVVSILSKLIITDNPAWQSIRECDILTMMLYGLYASLVFAAVAYFFYRPSLKDTAKRVDETGLFDRSATMLALKDSDTYIAAIQREDAVEKLKDRKPTDISFRDKEILTTFIAAAVSMILMIALHSGIGYDPFHTIVEAEPIPEEIVIESRIIIELIIQLRDDINLANVPVEIKNELYDMVDALELQVHDYDTTLLKAAKISEMRFTVMEIIERESVDLSVADAMEEKEPVSALGEAIKTGDSQKIADAMQKLNDELFEKSNGELSPWLSEVAEAINGSIEESGGMSEEEPDPIKQALGDLALAFAEAAVQADDEALYDLARATAGIPMIDTAQIIADSINEQSVVGNELQRIIGTLDSARNELFGIEETNSADEDENIGVIVDDPTYIEDPEYVIDPGQNGGQSGDTPDDADPEQGSSFFDPTQIENFGNTDYELTDEDFMRDLYQQIVKGGEVNYSDVYLDYYAAALENIARNDIPEKLREVIIKYFTSLD